MLVTEVHFCQSVLLCLSLTLSPCSLCAANDASQLSASFTTVSVSSFRPCKDVLKQLSEHFSLHNFLQLGDKILGTKALFSPCVPVYQGTDTLLSSFIVRLREWLGIKNRKNRDIICIKSMVLFSVFQPFFCFGLVFFCLHRS